MKIIMSIRTKSTIPKQKTTKQRVGASKPDTIISLKKEISRLQKEIDKMQIKIKTQAMTILTVRNQKAKTQHRFLVLQEKYDKIKKIQFDRMQLHADIAAIKAMEHDEPPEK
jgi:TolA-binding protein